MQVIEQVHDYLKEQELIQVDRKLGIHPDFAIPCRLYVTAPYARLAFMWHNNLFPSDSTVPPQLVSVYVPEWKERLILVHPERGFTYILGSDYFGEAKMSFLRLAMYFQKKKGGLGLHAGSKILSVRDSNGKRKNVGFLLFGLSGTGKTTLTLHDHELTGEERVTVLQDDVVMMESNAFCYGTEDRFYIKTEGLDERQMGLLQATRQPEAIFENVAVTEDGDLDFLNYELTTNGRAIVLREHIPHTSQEVDLPRADKMILITRRDDIVPTVARLHALQGAAFFMLGESIETSAGDPTKAGQAKREVGTNPFIIGPEAEEGNRIAEILKANEDIECFLVNTGSVGKGPKSKKGEKISVQVSMTIMREIARGSIQWQKDQDWGYEVPLSIPGVDLEKYNPKSYYGKEEYAKITDRLRLERLKWLEQFPGLNAEIIEALK